MLALSALNLAEQDRLCRNEEQRDPNSFCYACTTRYALRTRRAARLGEGTQPGRLAEARAASFRRQLGRGNRSDARLLQVGWRSWG
jgi:hypothetical protein